MPDKGNIMPNRINNFDPLSLVLSEGIPHHGIQPLIIETSAKGNVTNILKSYTGFFDLFSESIQNAIDGTEKRSRTDSDYRPEIHIEVSLKDKSVRVIDNGCGMKINEFLYCFSPNVSFKKGEKLRGNKGVGATFLAYGFNYVSLSSRTVEGSYSAVLRGGRTWAEDSTNRIPRPKLEVQEFNEELPGNSESGTIIELRLSGQGSEKPKDLGWHGATNAKQWFDILRITTPMGGVYLDNAKFYPKFVVKVIDYTGQFSTEEGQQVDYFYPHEINGLKTCSLGDIRKKMSAIEGDPQFVQAKLPESMKNLDCIYELWDSKSLLDEKKISQGRLNEYQKILIEQYKVMVYGTHLTTVKTFDSFNEILGLRKGIQFLRGGLQLATDNMVQGELLVIPLKRFTGYQRNTHIVVHFTDGNPDIGRKTFQPELKELAEVIAESIAESFIKYRTLLKADTGATAHITPDKELHVWKKDQEMWRDANPLNLIDIHENLSYHSVPQEEEDVIALYHQMIGCGLIKGINFFGSKRTEKYDALVEYNYRDSSFAYSAQNVLGVRSDLDFPWESEPKVLEYKYDLDALFRDFDKSIKFSKHISLAVCWKYSQESTNNMIIMSYLINSNGDGRYTFGATHRAVFPGTNDGFDIIILSELISYLKDQNLESAKQRAKYED